MISFTDNVWNGHIDRPKVEQSVPRAERIGDLWGGVTAVGYEVPLWNNKNVLEFACSDGCTYA